MMVGEKRPNNNNKYKWIITYNKEQITIEKWEITNQVLKMMVGNNLKETQLQQIVDKTILLYDKVAEKPQNIMIAKLDI